MHPDVGHGVSPQYGGGMDRGKEKSKLAGVFLHLIHAIFHAPFFVDLAVKLPEVIEF